MVLQLGRKLPCITKNTLNTVTESFCCISVLDCCIVMTAHRSTAASDAYDEKGQVLLRAQHTCIESLHMSHLCGVHTPDAL